MPKTQSPILDSQFPIPSRVRTRAELHTSTPVNVVIGCGLLCALDTQQHFGPSRYEYDQVGRGSDCSQWVGQRDCRNSIETLIFMQLILGVVLYTCM